MTYVTRLMLCALIAPLFIASNLCHAEDTGLSQKVYDDGWTHAVFTFRDGALIHEVAIFFTGDSDGDVGTGWTSLGGTSAEMLLRPPPRNPLRAEWMERFYADRKPVFVRTGDFDNARPPMRSVPARLLSESFKARSAVFVAQSGSHKEPYPQKLHVGGEAFEMGEDGFYHVVEMRDAVFKSSVLLDAEFSTPALDRERLKYLTDQASTNNKDDVANDMSQHSRTGAAIPSPDGTLEIHTFIEQSRSNPTAYGCVIIEIREKSRKALYRENTGASDFERWSVDWVSNARIRLKSSDVGTMFWSRQPDGTWKKE
jgi:hypothetical protein